MAAFSRCARAVLCLDYSTTCLDSSGGGTGSSGGSSSLLVGRRAAGSAILALLGLGSGAEGDCGEVVRQLFDEDLY